MFKRLAEMTVTVGIHVKVSYLIFKCFMNELWVVLLQLVADGYRCDLHRNVFHFLGILGYASQT